ncbi:LacI family DNA-binding transcriptional regulator [uncultured Roseovarius sp.]|uniref:LacI family DNA-binding transcriptional regulator n=1 Tax=uncultured Roseovarius sp. TaxID=293344 RepID=UPI0026142375|nr:LacI family DNA-binding transcriptional regulator [uncultured Roseovarius sp.]
MTGNKTVPTLDDVAKTAGVSTATVSRCINTPERVVENTRNRVLKVIDQLGYTPNFGARVMAAKRTYTIGAIIPTMENAIFARSLQAFQEALHQKGYTLLVASSAYRPDVEEEQIRALVSRGADGLLLIGHDRDASIYQYLKQREVPALIAWTFADDAPHPCIGFDNRASMRALTEEVLKRGHRRVGIISGATQGNDRARQRIEGIKDALTSNGLDPANLNIVETKYEIECGGEAFEKLMSFKKPPTAILCGNDVLAVGAIRRARELGLDVPGDVSITGFDDIELAKVVFPALTTVHVPHREMGSKAAVELVNMVETKSAGSSAELNTTIQIRGSLGHAKN